MKYLFVLVLLSMPLCGNATPVMQYVRVMSGTGFYINDMDIITNAHVVRGCNTVFIKGAVHEHTATVKVMDEVHDLALLETDEPPPQIAPLRFNIDDLHVGDRVFVAGYPGQAGAEGQYSVSPAMVLEFAESVNGNLGQFYITDVIEHGNSGGPVLDGSGNVIGVIVAKGGVNLINPITQKVVFEKHMGVVITLKTLKNFLQQQGASVEWNTTGQLSYSDNYVEAHAQNFIVNVQCRMSVAHP